MNTVDTVDYEQVAEGVRSFCAQRLYELEKGLRPMVDGTFGEVLPGHLAGYIATIRQLGKLYQVDKEPRALQNMVPMTKVQEILAGIREQHARELAEAVAVTEAKVRAELSSGTQLSIQAAKATVIDRLNILEGRG